MLLALKMEEGPPAEECGASRSWKRQETESSLDRSLSGALSGTLDHIGLSIGFAELWSPNKSLTQLQSLVSSFT